MAFQMCHLIFWFDLYYFGLWWRLLLTAYLVPLSPKKYQPFLLSGVWCTLARWSLRSVVQHHKLKEECMDCIRKFKSPSRGLLHCGLFRGHWTLVQRVQNYLLFILWYRISRLLFVWHETELIWKIDYYLSVVVINPLLPCCWGESDLPFSGSPASFSPCG